MYIYNVTTLVHWSIHDGWLQWMKADRMPAMVATGCIERYLMVKLLETDETEGATYAVQYFVRTKDDYVRYMENHEPALRAAGRDKWGEYCVSFSSIMELVN